MANEDVQDYSFDPFTEQGLDVQRMYAQAMAAKLRAASLGAGGQDVPMWQVGRTLGADIGADLDLKGVDKKRKELAEQYQKLQEAAFAGASPEITAMAKFPGTRKEAEAMRVKEVQAHMDEDEMRAAKGLAPKWSQGGALPGAVDAVGGVSSPSGGGALPQATAAAGGGGQVNLYPETPQEAYQWSQSKNALMAARGKVAMEAMKHANPENVGYVGPDGQFKLDPAALDAFAKREQLRVKPLEKVLDPTGKEYQVPQGSGPPGVAPPPQMQMPPPSGLQSAPQAQGMPSQVPVPSAVPPPGSPQPGQPGYTGYAGGSRQSGDQIRMAVLMNEYQQEVAKPQPNPQNVAALTQEITAMQKKGVPLPQAGPPMASAGGVPPGGMPPQGPSPMAQAAQAGPPQGLPPQQGVPPQAVRPPVEVPMPEPMGTPRPGENAPPGSGTDIPAIEGWKKRMETRYTAQEKFINTASNIPQIEDTLNNMRKIIARPGGMYTGYTDVQMMKENAISTVTGAKTPKGVNTELMDKESSDMRAGIIKEYGTGNSISDADLRATLSRIPNAGMSPDARMEAINTIQRSLDKMKWTTAVVRQMTDAGMPLAEAQIRASDAYNTELTKRRQSQSALPGAVGALPGQVREVTY